MIALLMSVVLSGECACAAAFDALTAKLEANYVAYHIDGAARARYENARERLQPFAARARDVRTCVRTLQQLVATFHDGHLFVTQLPRPSPDELPLPRTAPRRPSQRGENPIEGIWYARDGSRYDIRANPEGGPDTYVAVVRATKAEGWKPGEVKAEFRALSDGSYDVTLLGEDRVERHPALSMRGQQGGAALRLDGLLLHMPPHTWGRESSSRLDPTEPRRPTLRRFGEDAVIITIPSHAPEYRAVLDELLTRLDHELRDARILIIDLRGNEGGSSGTTAPLDRFLDAGREVVLSSPDNIAYFRSIESQGWLPPTLIARMEANPGKLVPFADVTPKRVAILIDRGVVSAAEAFVLAAKKRSNVTLFGENTAGTIDYQNVTMLRLGCRRDGYYLGYPTIAASPDLPEGGLNATGIAPDVRIPRGHDPFELIVQSLRR